MILLTKNQNDFHQNWINFTMKDITSAQGVYFYQQAKAHIF
jgi:hypothetical protein